MEKKYFYVDNLHEYGKRLYYKKHSLNWKFVQLSKKAVAHLKIGEIFYLGELERPLRCCGHSKYGDVLYEFDGGSNTNIYRLNSSMIVYIKKENK